MNTISSEVWLGAAIMLLTSALAGWFMLWTFDHKLVQSRRRWLVWLPMFWFLMFPWYWWALRLAVTAYITVTFAWLQAAWWLLVALPLAAWLFIRADFLDDPPAWYRQSSR